MAKIKPGLGKGIDTLIPTGLDDEKSGIQKLKISQIEPNRNQPRCIFDEEGLKSLAASMKKYGVIQPIVVGDAGDHYEIVAGERRWRAARIAGLKEIPAVISEYSAQEKMEITLIENIQREDLNPIEEAQGLKTLMDKYKLTQEELADRVFKSRTAVANSLRLLKLPEDIQNLLIEGKLSSGHARALLSLKEKAKLKYTAERVIEENLSVRQTETLVKRLNEQKSKKKSIKRPENDANYAKLEQNMTEALSAKVSIKQGSGGTGKIEIAYSSSDELERLYGIINYRRG